MAHRALGFAFLLFLTSLRVIGATQTSPVPDQNTNPIQKPERQLIEQLVATVNGEVLTRTDLIWFMVLDETGKWNDALESTETLDLVLPVIFEEVVRQLVLTQEARKFVGIVEVVKQEDQSIFEDPNWKIRIRETRKIFNNQMEHNFGSTFGERVSRLGLNLNDLDWKTIDQIARDQFIKFHFNAYITITREESETYYQSVYRSQQTQIVLPEYGELLTQQPAILKKIEDLLFLTKLNQEIERWVEQAIHRTTITPLTSFAEPVAQALTRRGR